LTDNSLHLHTIDAGAAIRTTWQCTGKILDGYQVRYRDRQYFQVKGTVIAGIPGPDHKKIRKQIKGKRITQQKDFSMF